MKKTYIKKRIDDLLKEAETKFGKKCEIMTLNMTTQMTGDGELFAHVVAIVDPEGDENSYEVTKDFDL